MYDDFNPADGRLFERCRNAYLLFYERVHPITEKVAEKETDGNFINGIENKLYQKIWDENGQFMKLKLFFDQEYFQFVRDYVSLYNFENVIQFS